MIIVPKRTNWDKGISGCQFYGYKEKHVQTPLLFFNITVLSIGHRIFTYICIFALCIVHISVIQYVK